MGKALWLIAGFMVGLLAGSGGLLYSQAQRPETEIMFARKMFYSPAFGGAEFVAMSGTLTGEGMAYPNNTYAVTCWSDKKECYVSSVEQIGSNQIGRLDGPYSYPIAEWTETRIVARDEAPSLACRRTT